MTHQTFDLLDRDGNELHVNMQHVESVNGDGSMGYVHFTDGSVSIIQQEDAKMIAASLISVDGDTGIDPTKILQIDVTDGVAVVTLKCQQVVSTEEAGRLFGVVSQAMDYDLNTNGKNWSVAVQNFD